MSRSAQSKTDCVPLILFKYLNRKIEVAHLKIINYHITMRMAQESIKQNQLYTL